jgi:hypothetical protein
MLKTILSAACASALLAGAAYAQSASSPTQDSTVQDPARMEKPGWTNQGGAKTQAYPSKSGVPSGFDKAEQKAMDGVSGDRTKAGDRKMSKTRSTTGASAGASSSIAPECAGMTSEQETTRCLNRHMAELAARGQSPTR